MPGTKADLAVSGDFDGDGRIDEAVMLVKGDEAALFLLPGSDDPPARRVPVRLTPRGWAMTPDH